MKIKILLLMCACVCTGTLLKAQLATADPAQIAQNATMISQNAATLSQAIETFKQMKNIYEQSQTSYKEFVQIKDYMANVEERLKNVGDLKDLLINKNEIMDKVFCIKQGNFYPNSLRFAQLIGTMRAAFLNCDNRALYNKTYGGVLQTMEESKGNGPPVGAAQVNSRLNDFNLNMVEAEKTSQLTGMYNSRMKLELGLKYKALSDELMNLSAETQRAINQDKGSSKNIFLSPAERLKMMDMVNQYQMQALEYEEKSARLLKEASEPDAQQQKELLRVKRDLSVKQMINFQL